MSASSLRDALHRVRLLAARGALGDDDMRTALEAVFREASFALGEIRLGTAVEKQQAADAGLRLAYVLVPSGQWVTEVVK